MDAYVSSDLKEKSAESMEELQCKKKTLVRQKPLKPRKNPTLKPIRRTPLIDPKLYCSTNEKPTVTNEEHNGSMPIEEKYLGENTTSNEVEDLAKSFTSNEVEDLGESFTSNEVEDLGESSTSNEIKDMVEMNKENNPQDGSYEISNSSSDEFEDISSKNCWRDDGTGEDALLELSCADDILPSLKRELKNIEDSVSGIRRNLDRARSTVEDYLARNNIRLDEEIMENIPPNQALSEIPELEMFLKELAFASHELNHLRAKFETLLNWKITNINAPIIQSRNQEWDPELNFPRNCQDQPILIQIRKHPRQAEEYSNNEGSFTTFLGNFFLVAALFAVLVVPPIYSKYSPSELWDTILGLNMSGVLREFKYE